MVNELQNLPVTDALARIEDTLISEGKTSYAKTYLSLRRSLEKYATTPDLTLKNLTHSDIQNYVDYLCNQKLRQSTIMFYIRSLRAIHKKVTRSDSSIFNDIDTSKANNTSKTEEQKKKIDPNSENWYAAKLFVRNYDTIQTLLSEYADETYIPMTTVAIKKEGKIIKKAQPLCSLIFFHTKHSSTAAIIEALKDKGMVYTSVTTSGRQPSIIQDREMKIFRLVTSGSEGIEYLDTEYNFKQGQRVRVIAGEFEGAEGTIVRIKKDRRLVVTITGICAVATPHLSPEILQKIS